MSRDPARYPVVGQSDASQGYNRSPEFYISLAEAYSNLRIVTSIYTPYRRPCHVYFCGAPRQTEFVLAACDMPGMAAGACE